MNGESKALVLLAVFGAFVLQAAQAVSLDGEWRLDYFPQPDDGAVRSLPLPDGLDLKSVKATVPGNCELDLVNAGILPPLEVGMNAWLLRPYEGYQWLYSREFTAPELKNGERLRLRFDAVDTLADVFINGVKIGECENMLIPHVFDVTKAVKNGTSNTLQVLIRSVMFAARDEIVGQLGHFIGNCGDAEPFRKAFHMGGWDILPRAFVAGLSRSVCLETVGPSRIDCVNWMVKKWDAKKNTASVNVYSRIRSPWSNIEKAKVRYSLVRNGRTAFEDVRPYHSTQNCIGFDFENPDLWWPRGSGEPALYDASIELLSASGDVLAADRRRIGIRTIRLERDDCYSNDRPGQFLFRVNGEPIFMHGTNWVPVDSLHGRDHLLIDSLLEMLVDLNCNMVRVWGGGVYELDRFYDWCDENGILVWQDFMMGCAVFPQNPQFLEKFRREVLDVVLRLRDHPSIAIWSGNNENDYFHAYRVGRELGPDPNRDRPSREIVPEVLKEFDVSRPYVPSSPYVSPDVFLGKAKQSEEHLWGGATYWKSGYYTNNPAWFIGETGYHGCPKLESLRAMMSEGCVYPWTNSADKTSFNHEWRYKATTPFMDPKLQPVLWRRPQMYVDTVRRMFGFVPENLEDFVEASEIVQAEALKYWIEMHRGRKFVKSNGILWWNLRDGWPVLSDAVVDYYNRRKLAYFAIRGVQKDVLASVRDLDRHAIVVNDRLKSICGHVIFRDTATGRILLERDFEIGSNSVLDLGAIDFSGLAAKGVIAIDGSAEGVDLRNHYLYGEQPFVLSDVRNWLKDRPIYDSK